MLLQYLIAWVLQNPQDAFKNATNFTSELDKSFGKEKFCNVHLWDTMQRFKANEPLIDSITTNKKKHLDNIFIISLKKKNFNFKSCKVCLIQINKEFFF